MSPWDKILEMPGPQDHLVQFYGQHEGSLIERVGRYLWEGLRQGDRVLAIATPAHIAHFQEQIRKLGGDPASAVRSRTLAFLDARETLNRFMINDHPDWWRFQTTIAEAIRQMKNKGDRPLRAYGEMVDLLWKDGRYWAATRLEHFWDTLLALYPLTLFCAYQIDPFNKDLRAEALGEILRAHTHVIPNTSDPELETRLTQAIDEVLGSERPPASYQTNGPVMSHGESLLLWLRSKMPEYADRIVDRVRQTVEA